MLGRRLRSIREALETFPDARGWRSSLGLFVIFVLAALVVGFATGFLAFRPLAGNAAVLATLPLVLLLKPALLEEIAFRAALVPHPSEGLQPARQWMFAALSLALFVGMHPVNGYFFHHAAFELFVNRTFLSLSLLLGIVCTAAYVTTGSLWPSVLMHWVAVTTWIELLGGAQWLGLSALGVNRS